MTASMPRTLLPTLLLLVAAALLRAQELERDLPWRRVTPLPAPQYCVEQGLLRLEAGWNWEAARMFRELLAQDTKAPLGHLLMALAVRDAPNRAARLCWDAVQRVESVPDDVKQLVAAYQRYFGVDSQPELVDPRFTQAPGRVRADLLIRDLEPLAKTGVAAQLASRLLAIERVRFSGRAQLPADQVASTLSSHHAYLQATGSMPFLVPGYADLLARSLVGVADREVLLAQLPRHPRLGVGPAAAVGPLPGFRAPLAAAGADRWRPQKAPGFDLPRGLGGRGKFTDYRERPVLVVFFLGFGCAHCVAQLAKLDPKTKDFLAAGIDVVTIGTDDVDQVKAARQAAFENGVDPLHFDVLCDPTGATFKQWGCWDEFGGEALHGTFLVDRAGRILWQDISARPFEDSDWLLAECQRLLRAW